MTEQTFTYRGRPVVDHRVRDRVRKMVQAAKKAEQQQYGEIPEAMRGKVFRRGTGYSVRVYVAGVAFNGPICKTPELAHQYYWSYRERAGHLHQLCVDSGISAKDLNRTSIGLALRS